MKLRTTLTILVMVSALVAQTARGTVPRASGESYPAHAQQAEATVGATLLTPEQIHKLFATDIGKCCLVVEVAVYPQPQNTVTVATADFVLRAGNSDIAARASSPELIAAMLQPRPASPSSSGGTDVVITPTSSVGYESGGYDPVTGQRRSGGVYTSAGVGVGVGAGGGTPQAGPSDRDRRVMELELREKSLPEGKAFNPVSGYLYFSLPKKEKKANYKLEYTLNGNKMVLALP